MQNISIDSINEFISTNKSTKNLSDKTTIAYLSDLKNFMTFANSVTFDENIVLKYIIYLAQEKNLKDTTIKRKLVVLKMFFAFLTEQKYIEQNYYDCHTFKFRQEKQLPKILTVSEVKKMLNFLESQIEKAKTSSEIFLATRNLALIDILVSTGIRISELSNISLSDIALSDHVILIKGKGRKQRLIYISCLQTWTNLTNWIKERKRKNPKTEIKSKSKCYTALFASYICNKFTFKRSRLTLCSRITWTFQHCNNRNLHCGHDQTQKASFK